VTVIVVRDRIARAAAPPRLARVRMVSACPALSLYLRGHGRARCRSTEHSGRPPPTRTVTRELAARTVAAPPAVRTPTSAGTTRKRLTQPFPWSAAGRDPGYLGDPRGPPRRCRGREGTPCGAPEQSQFPHRSLPLGMAPPRQRRCQTEPIPSGKGYKPLCRLCGRSFTQAIRSVIASLAALGWFGPARVAAVPARHLEFDDSRIAAQLPLGEWLGRRGVDGRVGAPGRSRACGAPGRSRACRGAGAMTGVSGRRGPGGEAGGTDPPP
jgi:hypothetical protein